MRLDEYRAARYPKGRKVHLLITDDDTPACGARSAVHPPIPTRYRQGDSICRTCWDAYRADHRQHQDLYNARTSAAFFVCELLLAHDAAVPSCVEKALADFLDADVELTTRRIERGAVL